MQDQSPLEPVLTLPAVVNFRIDQSAIDAIENGENYELPQFKNWDTEKYPSIRAVFIERKTQKMPKVGAPEILEEVDTVHFCAFIKGEKHFMYCCAKQFIRLIEDLRGMIPAGKDLVFSAKSTGKEKGKKFDYKTFSVGIIQTN